MRGAWFDGSRFFFRTDLPTPCPGPDEVLLRVQVAGVCDTDLQIVRGYLGFIGTPGHEFVAVTPDGRRVTAEINANCRTCEYCRSGLGNHCPNRTVLGIFGRSGAFADQVAVPAHCVHLIPDPLTDEQAVFIEPLAAAFQILEQIKVEPSQPVAVLGDGKLGLLCSWVLREAGAEVHWIGKHLSKLGLGGPGLTAHLLAETEALTKKFDLVVDATGSPTGLPTALNLVRPRGTIVLKTTVASSYQVDLAPIVIDEIRVVGSRCGPFQTAIEALLSGRFDVTRLIEAEYPLSSVTEAFAHAARPGTRKILIRVAEA